MSWENQYFDDSLIGSLKAESLKKANFDMDLDKNGSLNLFFEYKHIDQKISYIETKENDVVECFLSTLPAA